MPSGLGVSPDNAREHAQNRKTRQPLPEKSHPTDSQHFAKSTRPWKSGTCPRSRCCRQENRDNTGRARLPRRSGNARRFLRPARGTQNAEPSRHRRRFRGCRISHSGPNAIDRSRMKASAIEGIQPAGTVPAALAPVCGLSRGGSRARIDTKKPHGSCPRGVGG